MNQDPETPITDEEAQALFAPLAGEMPARDLKAASQARANFLAAVDQLPLPLPASPKPINRFASFVTLFRKERKMIPLITSILIALVLTFGGAGATAYAAQDSLPGDALYPVKTFTEDLSLALTFNDDAQLERSLEFAERRMTELLALEAAGREIPAGAAEKAAENVDRAFQLAAGQNPEDQAQAAVRLEQALQVQARLLEKQQDSPSPVLAQVRQMVNEHLRLLQAGNGNLDPTQIQIQQQDRDRVQDHAGTPQGEPQHTPGTPQGNPAHTPGTPQGNPDHTPGTPQGNPAHTPGTPQGPKTEPPGNPNPGNPEVTPGTPQGPNTEPPGNPNPGTPQGSGSGKPEGTPGNPNPSATPEPPSDPAPSDTPAPSDAGADNGAAATEPKGNPDKGTPTPGGQGNKP